MRKILGIFLILASCIFVACSTANASTAKNFNAIKEKETSNSISVIEDQNETIADDTIFVLSYLVENYDEYKSSFLKYTNFGIENLVLAMSEEDILELTPLIDNILKYIEQGEYLGLGNTGFASGATGDIEKLDKILFGVWYKEYNKAKS